MLDRLPDPTPSPPWPDPFPTLTLAKKYLWRAVDWWAYRRMQRLGVPSPWMAYEMGRRDQSREYRPPGSPFTRTDIERALNRPKDKNP